MGTRPGAPRGPLSSICSQGSRRQLPWGEAQGEEGGTALYSARALGAPSATAPNPQAATAFQINSLALPGSLSAPGGVVPLHPGPGCPSQVHIGWPLPPQSRAHLHSGHARLLSLFLTPPHTLFTKGLRAQNLLEYACPIPGKHQKLFLQTPCSVLWSQKLWEVACLPSQPCIKGMQAETASITHTFGHGDCGD